LAKKELGKSVSLEKLEKEEAKEEIHSIESKDEEVK
jgi:hypothetical protein